MPTAFLSDLDERVTSHVLNTFVCLVHELEELVDDGLEELPVCFEEAGILSNNVHDVGCDDSFVVFATFDFTQTQQILDDSNKEPFFCLLI